MPCLLAILVLGWSPVPKVRAGEKLATKEEAIKEIERLGGMVFFNEHGPGRPVSYVDLNGTQVTKKSLKLLQCFPNLTYLELAGTGITDQEIPLIASHKSLICLGLANTKRH